MSYTISQTNDDRPDAPIYPTVEAALMAAFGRQDEAPWTGVLVIYDHVTGDVICLVWAGRAWWR